jgi:hypothetical protein
MSKSSDLPSSITCRLQEGVENHICGARGAVCGKMLSSFSFTKEKQPLRDFGFRSAGMRVRGMLNVIMQDLTPLSPLSSKIQLRLLGLPIQHICCIIGYVREAAY